MANQTHALAVDQNGNVGIGTASPSQKLEIDRGNIILDRLRKKGARQKKDAR
ncbi:MAG: hypothetical protein ACYS1A_18715 [Planctomycetota bacterium]